MCIRKKSRSHQLRAWWFDSSCVEVSLNQSSPSESRQLWQFCHWCSVGWWSNQEWIMQLISFFGSCLCMTLQLQPETLSVALKRTWSSCISVKREPTGGKLILAANWPCGFRNRSLGWKNSPVPFFCSSVAEMRSHHFHVGSKSVCCVFSVVLTEMSL